MSNNGLICEHKNCRETENVSDYFPLESDLDEEDYSEDEREDWAKEPIALCPKHAGARKKFLYPEL